MKTPALLLAAVGAVAGLSTAAQAQFTQVNRIFLTNSFNADSAFGDQPTSIAFDGTTAYIGGINNGGNVDSAGIVAVSNLTSTLGFATQTGLAGTVNALPGGRSFNSVAYDPATNSVLAAVDTGAASTGFVARYNTDGTQVFKTVSPNGRQPVAVGADPMAPGGDPSLAAFLSQGSGRRLALDIDDGSVVYGTSDGGVIFNQPVNTAFRGIDFKPDGDLAYATANGFAVYDRTGVNSFAQTSTILGAGNDNLGRDIAFLEGVGAGGSDLLAIVARDSTVLAGQSISDTNVYITDLQGNIVQTLTGASSFSAAFANDTKQLDFAFAPDGTPTLVVADLAERRLDVFQIAAVPEPTSLGLLGVCGLALLRRRRA